MKKKQLNINLTILNYIILLLLSCNLSSNQINNPTIGKYRNVKDSSDLYIYSNKTYKTIRTDTAFQGEWVFIAPNEIGFKNWKDRVRGNVDYKFGIVKKNAIIFDLDNDFNNYFLERINKVSSGAGVP